jgi:hypothetical protein
MPVRREPVVGKLLGSRCQDRLDRSPPSVDTGLRPRVVTLGEVPVWKAVSVPVQPS